MMNKLIVSFLLAIIILLLCVIAVQLAWLGPNQVPVLSQLTTSSNASQSVDVEPLTQPASVVHQPDSAAVKHDEAMTTEQPADSTNATNMANVPTKEAILLHDGGWRTLRIINAIATVIIQHGYGYPVEQIRASSFAMHDALPLGDIDAVMEIWGGNKPEWYEAQVASGRILDVGAIAETATQGWYVPRYVIEGDVERDIAPMAPDLKSAMDVSKYQTVFKDPKDPQKGVWINCIDAWICHRIAQVRAAAYGFDKTFNVVIPTSVETLENIIINAYENGEPILFHYWAPSALLGRLDVVKLEEPPFSEDCWQKISAAAESEELGKVDEACGYQIHHLNKIVYSGLLDRAPELVIFIRNMFLGTQRLQELSAYMEVENIESNQVAIYYLQTYEEEWTSWVPDDVAARVKAMLP